MARGYVYDKSKYHMGEGASYASSWEQASASALFILRWMIEHNLVSDFFVKELAADSLAEFQAGRMTLYQLYEKECDLCLIDDMISEEGNRFGRLYFDYEKGRYLGDLEQTLNYQHYPTYSEEAFEKIRPLLDERYAGWQRGVGDLTKPLPGKVRQISMKILGFILVLAIFATAFFIIWLLKWLLYPR